MVSLLRKEAKTAGWKLEEVINEMMVRNWTGFKADWVKDDWKDPNAHWVTAAEYNKELLQSLIQPAPRTSLSRNSMLA
ncbi:MAG: hypothetical protein ACLSE8_15560 [Parasutterella sp.]